MSKRPKKLRDDQVKRRGGEFVELEPDAEEIFLKSLENMDPRAAKQKLRDEALSRPSPGKGGASDPSSSTPSPGKGMRDHSLDLHRMTLVEAEAAVDRFLAPLLTGRGGEVTVTIVTGKGRHSGEGGGVLAKEIHGYVRRRYGAQIVAIEESPADLKVGGLPLRGHFKVVFARR
jgi:hypothetical protein